MLRLLPRSLFWSLLTVGCVAWLASPAHAQGLFGSNSPSTGNNGRGTAASGARGSTSGATGSQMEMGGLSSGGLGNGSLGAGGGRQSGSGSSPQGALRGSQAGGRFVGSRQAGQASQLSNNANFRTGLNQEANMIGPGSQVGMQGRNNQNRNNARNNARNNQGQQFGQNNMANDMQARRQIRPSLKVGFDHEPADVRLAHVRLSARVDKLSDRKEFRGIRMHSDGDTVVLRGEVKNAETRRLLERMAMLDPAISEVRNELTVAGEAAAAESEAE